MIQTSTTTDFFSSPTARTVASGEWSDPATWGGTVPGVDDIVLIDVGHEVTLAADVTVRRLGVLGELTIPQTARTLATNLFLIMDGGKGRCVGQLPDFDIVIRDYPGGVLEFMRDDPEQEGQGVITYGELVLHGLPKTPFCRLAVDALAGDSTLTLETAPSGWAPGDVLVLPDTRQHVQGAGTTVIPQHLWVEEATISAIDGVIVTLAEPLQYDHRGSSRLDGTSFRRGHVANITRSVRIRSENPSGIRGHMLGAGRAGVDVRYVASVDMGRTSAAPIGTSSNVNGRYALHVHDCPGPVNPNNSGYQFVFEGCSVVRGRKWGIEAGNAHFGLIAGNVVYDVQGAGIVTEFGHEFGNEIRDNIVIKSGVTIQSFPRVEYGGTGGPGRTLGFGDFGHAGDGFWISGNGNSFERNVAANCAHSPFNWNGRAAGKFADFYPKYPKYRGADPADPSAWTDYTKPYRVPPAPQPRLDNEAYSCALGPWLGFSQDAGMWLRTDCWHVQNTGLYSARNRSATWCELRLINDPVVSAQAAYSTRGLDIEASTYLSGKLRFEDCICEGYLVGFILPGTRGKVPGAEVLEFVRGRLHNWVNVVETSAQDAKQTIFRSTEFALTGNKPVSRYGFITPPYQIMPSAPKHFVGYINRGNLNACAVVESRLISYDHNKTGVDVEYFLPDQGPDVVMPTRSVLANGVPLAQHLINCPTAGLTNAQCMLQHGVATLGRVATSTEQLAAVDGYLVPLDGSSLPPDEPPVEPPPLPDDIELVIAGRRYRLTDLGVASIEDGLIRLGGIEYRLLRQ